MTDQNPLTPEPFYDPEFTDPRNVDGNPKLRGRLRDGFATLAAGNDEDLSDCREDISEQDAI